MDRRRHRLVERRRTVGLSQERLAEAVGVDTSTVARWERGETEPQPVHRPRLAEALRVPLADVAAWLADPNRQLAHTAVNRMPQPVTDSDAGGTEHRRQLPDAEVHASAIRSLRVADRQVGGGYLYATVVGYLQRDVAASLFHTPHDSDGRAVFTAAAALTEMAGWMAYDAGRDHTAREHFSRASDLARVGGDRQLTAHVLASISHLAHHQRQPTDAIGFAQRGREELTGGPSQPELEAQLTALEARGMAAIGNTRTCTKLLDRAETTLASGHEEPPSPWVSRFDQASLAAENSRCLRQLGDLNAAARHAERIIALRPPARVRSRALGNLLLVTVLLAQGNLDQACAIAQQVLDATEHLGSYPVLRQLLDLKHRLQPHRDAAAASELLDHLDQALQQRCWLHPTQTHPQPAATIPP